MRLVPLTAAVCHTGHCPTVYIDADGQNDVVVQGCLIHGQQAPDGEAMVRVPRELLLQAARKLLAEG